MSMMLSVCRETKSHAVIRRAQPAPASAVRLRHIDTLSTSANQKGYKYRGIRLGYGPQDTVPKEDSGRRSIPGVSSMKRRDNQEQPETDRACGPGIKVSTPSSVAASGGRPKRMCSAALQPASILRCC